MRMSRQSMVKGHFSGRQVSGRPSGNRPWENRQSEFLQVAAFAIAAADLVFKGSSESPDSDERVEAKLDAIVEHLGLDVKQTESELPPKYRKMTRLSGSGQQLSAWPLAEAQGATSTRAGRCSGSEREWFVGACTRA
jgi:hypothetical protein